jgi:hypothetical protein
MFVYGQPKHLTGSNEVGVLVFGIPIAFSFMGLKLRMDADKSQKLDAEYSETYE